MFKVGRGHALKTAVGASATAAIAGALILSLGLSAGNASALATGAHRASARRANLVTLGQLDNSTGSTSPSAPSAEGVVDVQPAVTHLSGGTVKTTYQLPDGQALTSTTPPVGFDPLVASDAALQEYGFPERPTDPSALADWTTAMDAYTSDSPPSEPLQIATSITASLEYAPQYGWNWGGYIAGTQQTQSHWFVALKDAFSLPSTGGKCLPQNYNDLGFWIGLGGTLAGANTLVQQGVVCGNSDVGSGSSWRPFIEFANTTGPFAFCGYSAWTPADGSEIYENMSYQTSSNEANFYLENETTGVAHSCSLGAPNGWSFDGNTAEWIGEAPAGQAAKFGSVTFTDANAELGSSGSWVTLGSRTLTEVAAGYSASNYCIVPGDVGSDAQSFTDSWGSGTCP